MVNMITAPPAKKATEAVGAAIQIKISPATDKNPAQTKSNIPYKTCFKVIGK